MKWTRLSPSPLSDMLVRVYGPMSGRVRSSTVLHAVEDDVDGICGHDLEDPHAEALVHLNLIGVVRPGVVHVVSVGDRGEQFV